MSKSETNTILRTARHWGASRLSCADGEGQRAPVGNVTDRSVNRSAFGQEVGHARDRGGCLVRATVELELRVLRIKYEDWGEGGKGKGQCVWRRSRSCARPGGLPCSRYGRT